MTDHTPEQAAILDLLSRVQALECRTRHMVMQLQAKDARITELERALKPSGDVVQVQFRGRVR